MTELFEEIFEAVQEAMDLDWWELYDGPGFDVVVEMIAMVMHITVDELVELDEFCEWDEEMAGDL